MQTNLKIKASNKNQHLFYLQIVPVILVWEDERYDLLFTYCVPGTEYF